MSEQALWEKFKKVYLFDSKLGFALDVSRMKFDETFIQSNQVKLAKVYESIKALENGEIANPDEKRMVGHYWLRDSSIAPNSEIKAQIDNTLNDIKKFASEIHSGKISPPKGGKFQYLLVVGIGGSALGPQFVNQALGNAGDKMHLFFFDNTDPDGMNKALAAIPDLAHTLCIIISKSGGTKETRNGQLVAKQAFKSAGLDFSKHFVAVTGANSELDQTALKENWMCRFPMWDWVGGRTSELSAVGLLPAALQGFNIDEILVGAKSMDALTRRSDTVKNPAALLALSWLHAGGGKGSKDMVVLPYKDRLELFSKYLQQLLMESLGKEHDLDGKVVNQGIAVYGNKGSTDQHAYVQQLRDGVHNFFVVFIEVLKDGSTKTLLKDPKFNAVTMEVEEIISCGDYLEGFYLGTRKALFDKDRESISITINEVNEFYVGLLIALFERAVSIYAGLININAYHQPGVEAGKKAAAAVLDIQKKAFSHIQSQSKSINLEELAAQIGESQNVETVFKVLRHLAANSRIGCEAGDNVFADKYKRIG
jgi:glucose-6-phosphate isomerase